MEASSLFEPGTRHLAGDFAAGQRHRAPEMEQGTFATGLRRAPSTRVDVVVGAGSFAAGRRAADRAAAVASSAVAG
jgi:hypothetical protein